VKIAFDTNVAIYARSDDTGSPFRASCRRLLELAAQGAFQAEASVEFVQEFVHVRTRLLGDRLAAAAEAVDLARAFTLHPVEMVDVLRALDLFTAVPGLDALDAVHAATALRHGAEAIVTADRAFDRVPGLRRVDPREAEAVLLSEPEGDPPAGRAAGAARPPGAEG
jgi:predicted nucleic acid-binding protein